jgi:hypothetical protein
MEKKEVFHPGKMYTFHLINGDKFESWIEDRNKFSLFSSWQEDDIYLEIGDHIILSRNLIHVEISYWQDHKKNNGTEWKNRTA